MRPRVFTVTLALAILLSMSLRAEDRVRHVLLRDVISIEGVRDNPLVGYGLVVGLKGTGDRRQTFFTVQTLANILQRMGLQIPVSQVAVNNIAAVFVTASLPPFAQPGTRVDVTVSSVGDAKSIEGGMLLLTSLKGADGETYASAQGPLTLGGYTAGSGANSKITNHPTVGRVPNGGIVERELTLDLRKLPRISMLLSEANFSAARDAANAINKEFQRSVAVAVDSRRIDLDSRILDGASPATVLARIEALPIAIESRAKVVVNERTGTIVFGKDVRLSAVSILHGTLSIQITTQYNTSQPAPMSQGYTVTTPETTVNAEESATNKVALKEGASVDELVSSLQSIGATARDVIAILQAIKAAGALEADLEVI
ncbi:MAG TPA: flagellar basal body P-ring protein FlgI [Terriglobales bacterium]|nr:flagellar basal body P-ring protein FlgI [Terriglobales bacterium]